MCHMITWWMRASKVDAPHYFLAAFFNRNASCDYRSLVLSGHSNLSHLSLLFNMYLKYTVTSTVNLHELGHALCALNLNMYMSLNYYLKRTDFVQEVYNCKLWSTDGSFKFCIFYIDYFDKATYTFYGTPCPMEHVYRVVQNKLDTF